jgi:hypothetical protein
VFSSRGLCDGLITRPEESYRLRCVVVCDKETSKTRRLKPATGLWKIQPHWVVTPGKQTTNSAIRLSLTCLDLYCALRCQLLTIYVFCLLIDFGDVTSYKYWPIFHFL